MASPARPKAKVRSDGLLTFEKQKLDARRASHDDLVTRYSRTPPPTNSGASPSLHQPSQRTPQPAVGVRGSSLSPLPPLRGASDASPALDAEQRSRQVDAIASEMLTVAEPELKHDGELEAVVQGSASAKRLPARLKMHPEMLLQRESVKLLESWLDHRLVEVHKESKEEEVSRHDSVVAAHNVLSDVAHELTRQVAAQCEERGRLFARVWLRYTDVVNSLLEAWESEQHRHAMSEQQASKHLQQARRDYATVVAHSETMLRQAHAEMARVQESNMKVQAQLNTQLEQSKMELRRLQALVRRAVRSEDVTVLVPKTDGEADLIAGAHSNDAAKMRRHITELETTLLDRDATVRDLEKRLTRLELEYIDSKAEVVRLRDFLRGTPGMSSAAMVEHAAVSTQTERGDFAALYGRTASTMGSAATSRGPTPAAGDEHVPATNPPELQLPAADSPRTPRTDTPSASPSSMLTPATQSPKASRRGDSVSPRNGSRPSRSPRSSRRPTGVPAPDQPAPAPSAAA